MEVIKAGDKELRVASRTDTIAVKCGTCKAELRVYPFDLIAIGGFIRKRKYRFCCSECYNVTTITPGELPDSFRRRVDMENSR